MNTVTDMVGNHRKIVVLGELGSGKSELAINIAMMLKNEVRESVVFFDMDQTKPMFRSRESSEVLTEAGIKFSIERQYMDAPTVPSGVKECLADNSVWMVMDVGGSSHGAYCMGQFAEAIERSDSIVLYIINPFRAFSDTTERIGETMYTVCRCAGIFDVKVVCNPYLGKFTTSEDVISGRKHLEELIAPLGKEIIFNMVPDFIWEDTCGKLPGMSIKTTPYLRRVASELPLSLTRGPV